MDPFRPRDLVARVVAWHNRHPLALRVGAHQIHSLGAVALPFVAAGSDARRTSKPVATTSAATGAGGVDADAAPLAERLREARQRAMAATAGSSDAAAPDDAPPGGLADGAPAAADASSDEQEQEQVEAPAPAPAPAPAQAPVAGAVRRGRRAGLRRLRAAFRETFLWPVPTRRIARWARRHAGAEPWAPPDWPCRHIERIERLGEPAVSHRTLHALTAGIGIGDRRLRVLVGADGAVLGARAYDRRRVALAASVVASLALLVASPALRRGAPPAAAQVAAAHAPPPAPRVQAPNAKAADAAPDAAASKPSLAPASGVRDARAPAPPAGTDDHGHDQGHGKGPDGEHPRATAAAPHGPSEAGPHGGAGSGAAADDHSDPRPRFLPPHALAQRASAPLVALRPRLDGMRDVNRDAIAAARARRRGASAAPVGTADAASAASAASKAVATSETKASTAVAAAASAPSTSPPPPPARRDAVAHFAVVAAPRPERADAEGVLAQMMAVRARLPRQPDDADRGELMPHGGAWRATWWPFASRADAERARSLLAVRGVSAEVVAF